MLWKISLKPQWSLGLARNSKNAKRFFLLRTLLLACFLVFMGVILFNPSFSFAQNIPPRPASSALSDPLAPPKPEPLRVVHDANYWPFSFKDKTEYAGFDIELWLQISKHLEQDYIFEPMPFQDIVPALEAGSIDIAIAAIPATSTRAERVEFTIPYFRSGLRVLCRKGEEIKNISELQNKKIALERDSLAEEFATEELDAKNLRYCSYHEEMFFELLAGNVDVVLAEYSLLLAYLNLTKNPDLVIAELWIKPYNIAIAMPKNSPHHKALNKALQNFKASQAYKDLCLKWFGKVPVFTGK